jgi:secretion/DNA translocation related TadE-like protein
MTPNRRRNRAQTGNASLATIVLALGLGLALLIGGAVLVYVQAAHRARAAADLAALAAATTALTDFNDVRSCDAARAVALGNGAQVDACKIVRAGSEIAVSVTVIVKLVWTIPGLESEVFATSYAGNPPT